MILNNSQNRKIINEYLEKVKEDSFINEIIIPLFSSQGYTLFRINSHGPGEKGKDLIFYRHIELFHELEYIAIQAKAEKVTANNVVKIADQLTMAYKTSFPGKSGNGLLKPNYAILVNSKRHTADSIAAFPDLVDNNSNIKYLTKENVCELIMRTGIIPPKIYDELALESIKSSSNKYDQEVFDIILKNKPTEIEQLFEHKLKHLSNEISDETKKHIIEYLFDLWDHDSSWEGSVKPLYWLSLYFDFIKGEQAKLLVKVVEEYVSRTPSFKAKEYVRSIISQITLEQIKCFSSEFVEIASWVLIRKQEQEAFYVFPKLKELLKKKYIKNKNTIEKSRVLVIAYNSLIKGDKKKYREQIEKYDTITGS